MRVQNYEELKKLVEKLKANVQLRDVVTVEAGESHEILVGLGENALENKSCLILEKFMQVLGDKGIKNVRMVRHGDFGDLHKPTVVQVNEVGKDSVTYEGVDVDFVEKIVDYHFIKGEELTERRVGL